MTSTDPIDYADRQFRLLADSIPQLVWLAEPDGRVVWYNRRWYDYTGTTLELMQLRGWQSVHDTREVPNLLEQWQRCVAAGEAFEGVYSLKGKDGGFRPFLRCVVPVKDEAGRVQSWLGTDTDTTERTRAAEVEHLMIAMVESADDVIVTKSLDGVVRSWNPAAQRMLGYRVEEIVGRSVAMLIPEDRQDEESMILERIRTGQQVAHFETVRRRKDGSTVEVSLTISPVRDHTGIIVGASKIMRDITERKKMEAQTASTLQRQRLMVNELNHRVKNTLAVVQAIACQTLMDVDPLRYESFEDRLSSLALAHGVLTRESWTGADLKDVVLGQIAPYGGGLTGRFHLTGSQLRLNVRATLALARVLHELATNALKYGALSNETGEVHIRWEIAESLLKLTWTERRGPRVGPPSKRGFGSQLIEHSLAGDLGGVVRLDFNDPQGISCVIETPLAQVVALAGDSPHPESGGEPLLEVSR